MAQAVFMESFGNTESSTTYISEIIDVRDGTHESPKAVENGFPLVTSKHLLPYGVDTVSPNRISKADFDKINERSKVNTHDILISMIGTIGIISLVIENNISFAIKNVGLFKTSQKEEWVYFILCNLRSATITQHIETRLAGSTQKYISLGELRQLPILIPKKTKLRGFNETIKPIFDEIVNRTEESRKLALLRDTLLPRLMSGELPFASLDGGK
jgi:type I restriction enzyme S subunit